DEILPAVAVDVGDLHSVAPTVRVGGEVLGRQLELPAAAAGEDEQRALRFQDDVGLAVARDVSGRHPLPSARRQEQLAAEMDGHEVCLLERAVAAGAVEGEVRRLPIGIEMRE